MVGCHEIGSKPIIDVITTSCIDGYNDIPAWWETLS
jgi:hypothetical protein